MPWKLRLITEVSFSSPHERRSRLLNARPQRGATIHSSQRALRAPHTPGPRRPAVDDAHQRVWCILPRKERVAAFHLILDCVLGHKRDATAKLQEVMAAACPRGPARSGAWWPA